MIKFTVMFTKSFKPKYILLCMEINHLMFGMIFQLKVFMQQRLLAFEEGLSGFAESQIKTARDTYTLLVRTQNSGETTGSMNKKFYNAGRSYETCRYKIYVEMYKVLRECFKMFQI